MRWKVRMRAPATVKAEVLVVAKTEQEAIEAARCQYLSAQWEIVHGSPNPNEISIEEWSHANEQT